jgi:uncharacterized protein YecT (DUF1311 family)
MKKITAFLPFLLLFSALFGQSITPEAEKKLMQKVEKETLQLKDLLLKNKEQTGESDSWIMFKTDTFKIERYTSLRMETDFSTQGMNQAMWEAQKRYDLLLNKYYQLLLKKLEGDDKKLLIEAQRAWIAFRDKEIKLIQTLNSDKYTGGGTMYSNISVGNIFQLTKDRAIQLALYCMEN